MHGAKFKNCEASRAVRIEPRYQVINGIASGIFGKDKACPKSLTLANDAAILINPRVITNY